MSCTFDARGDNLNDCFNKCQETTTATDCSTECNDICGNCSNGNMCLWLSQKNSEEIDQLKANYTNLTNKIIEYKKQEKDIWNSDLPEEEGYNNQIELLQKISDLEERRKVIWNFLVNEYKSIEHPKESWILICLLILLTKPFLFKVIFIDSSLYESLSQTM